MNRNFLLTVFALLCAATGATAQTAAQTTTQPQTLGDGPGTKIVTAVPTGTVRTKFEYQPGEGNARFDVRTARFGIGGKVYQRLDYMMEIDMSDEGKMKMVNAWVGAPIYKGFGFNIGFMRVPFSIDAHRSPHTQYFANRSFIAKQMGNVRDVGATLGWKFGEKIPVNIQAGVFNGSGLPEDLQRYWTRSFNYSAKVQAGLLPDVNFVAGYHTTKPAEVRMQMYDAGITFIRGRWLVEGEYLRKEYGGGAWQSVNSFDAFALYWIPTAHATPFNTIAFLGRWDYLGDHSNGIPGAEDGSLVANDPARHRVTAGVTFSLGLPFQADIRLNYEKYFYRAGVTPGPSDHDKIVIELMAHF